MSIYIYIYLYIFKSASWLFLFSQRQLKFLNAWPKKAPGGLREADREM